MSGKSLLKTIVLPPASGSAPTATLIFAHGLGDSGAGWYDVAQMLSRRPALKHVRFVLPNAPVQPVSLNMGMKVGGSVACDAYEPI
jgi:lysophospholipase-2